MPGLTYFGLVQTRFLCTTKKCLDQVELRFLYKTKSILTGSKNKIFCVKTKMFGPSQNNSGPTKGQIILQIYIP